MTLIICAAVWILSSGLPKRLFQSDKLLASALILAAFLAVIFWRYRISGRGFDDSQLVLLIMAAGIMLRVIYIWSTHYTFSPHDIGSILETPDTTDGHLGYIAYLFYNGHLPDFDPRNVWGFYNPPFFHIIGALWLKLNTLLGISWQASVENLCILTLLYTSLCVVVSNDIFELFEIKGRIKVVLVALVAFFPTLTWFAGTLSTDSLALLFMLLIFKYSVLWYQQRKLSQIIKLAFAIGLGMMTKLSCALLSIGTAFLFLRALIQAIKSRGGTVGRYLLQFVIFGVICVPLGLFWPVRCKLLFDMPLNYIPAVAEPSSQFIGDASVWARLGIPSFKQLIYPKVKFDTSLDTNIWLTLFRTALFDEGDMINLPTKVSALLGVILLYANLLLALTMNGCYVYLLCKKDSGLKTDYKIYTAIIYALVLGSYIKFCFDFPQICTMNFRYIAFLFILPCVASGLFIRDLVRSEKWLKVLTVAVAAISCLSALLYLRYCVTI